MAPKIDADWLQWLDCPVTLTTFFLFFFPNFNLYIFCSSLLLVFFTVPPLYRLCLLFSLTSEVLTFWRWDHVFHLMLVYSGKHKAFFIPPSAEQDDAHLHHAPSLHRTEFKLTLYKWVFTSCTCLPLVFQLSH